MEVNLLQEEVTQLREIKDRTDKLVVDLGSIAIQKVRLELLEEALKQEIKEITSLEQQFSENLVTKYGPISIDIEKGTAFKITE